MPTEPHAPIRGRALLALRACAAHPQGLRRDAYPTYMPMLVEMGLVEERRARGPGPDAGRVVPDRGRAVIAELGPSEVRE
ncbi:hypothetical protein MKL09_09340 [Methylobacterium sp. J-048]|uniref:hypothetical protein n=1 Tax=unclassified Methylobacterium TaxID=2615210 RepID=UPI001FBADB86|nr:MULTISPECIES: hypothetical protein [unclassified Methylobacterium]MCJ2056758.1 hypothetical protein [Methylobacterium sp. J-048]MCJ2094934.1 hypothetical protein [Methylobacterium sp. J-072]